jgi:hypothetical protein
VAIVGIRDRASLRWLGGMAGGLAVSVILWVVAVWLPNRDAVAAVVRTWPPETLPGGIGGVVERISQYIRANDGTLSLSAALLIGAGIGALVSFASWRRLIPEARLMLAVGVGWAVAGFGTLAIVPYSPNRYVVPTLPALALVIAVGAHAAIRWLSPEARRSILLAAVGVLAAVLLAAPGLGRYAGWMGSTATTLPQIQERVRTIIPAGAVVEGPYAPLFAMRADATTIITNFGANPGDLYATRGVRWYVGGRTSSPAWAPLHPGPWSQRHVVTCVTWAATPVCIYQLP